MADYLYINASNKQLKKDEQSWTQYLQRYHKKKNATKMTEYEKQKYTKKSFTDKLISMKSTS